MFCITLSLWWIYLGCNLYGKMNFVTWESPVLLTLSVESRGQVDGLRGIASYPGVRLGSPNHSRVSWYTQSQGFRCPKPLNPGLWNFKSWARRYIWIYSLINILYATIILDSLGLLYTSKILVWDVLLEYTSRIINCNMLQSFRVTTH